MQNTSFIQFNIKEQIAEIILNRPEQYNTLTPELIAELSILCESISQRTDIQIVLLKGAGKHFCAGADLNSMRTLATRPFNENKADALKLAHCFHKLSTLPQPLIGVVQGAVYGGGLGLVACCDVVLASEYAEFCFSEVKLGLIPATITPYIIRKIGYSHTKALFISAEKFQATFAREIGLIHKMVDPSKLNAEAEQLALRLKENSPLAMARSKQLVDHFYPIESGMIDFTAELLAHVRASDDAQKRIDIFLK